MIYNVWGGGGVQLWLGASPQTHILNTILFNIPNPRLSIINLLLYALWQWIKSGQINIFWFLGVTLKNSFVFLYHNFDVQFCLEDLVALIRAGRCGDIQFVTAALVHSRCCDRKSVPQCWETTWSGPGSKTSSYINARPGMTAHGHGLYHMKVGLA